MVCSSDVVVKEYSWDAVVPVPALLSVLAVQVRIPLAQVHKRACRLSCAPERNVPCADGLSYNVRGHVHDADNVFYNACCVVARQLYSGQYPKT